MTLLAPADGLPILHPCSQCQTPKPSNEFAKCARTARGFVYVCKICRRASGKIERARWSPEKRKAANFQSRIARIRRWYGIEFADYQWLLDSQNSGCALCGNVPPKRLHIDHDHRHHENPKQACPHCIRGLLCGWCNLYLVPIMERAIDLQSAKTQAYLSGRPLMNRMVEEPKRK